MITESIVQSTTITAWMEESCAAVREASDYLTQLDSAIGDGDHGLNMTRGFDSVTKALAGQDASVPPGRLLILGGKTLVSTVGGASGPLWGTALRRAGRSLGDRSEFAGEELVAALEACLGGVVELGAAAPGEKTMVDALDPAVEALRRAVEAERPLPLALTAAAEAAEEGMRATIPMQARKGRASYLGERSIGHQDPGATSTALIIRALETAVAGEA
jgi:phosphoenolpyruvate---glycerone phosphotransferase subunit DhaL